MGETLEDSSKRKVQCINKHKQLECATGTATKKKKVRRRKCAGSLRLESMSVLLRIVCCVQSEGTEQIDCERVNTVIAKPYGEWETR